jgi:lipopolysaccharide heptosyltransferase I
MIENGSMKVAVVKLSSIGDVVHALPVAVALKRSSAAFQVSWIAEAREATLLVGHPAIDEVIVADTRGWRRARPRLAGARAALGVTRELRRRAFDVAIDLQGLIKSGLLTAATRAPRRIGFAAGFRRERPSALFTNENVRPPASACHVVDQYLALLRPLGITDAAVDFRIPLDAGAETRADEFLAGAGIKAHDRLVLVNPGAGRPNKRWPVERFRELARRLADEAGARLVVLWGPGEEGDARAIASAARGAALIAPPTTLRELVALARRARLVIAGDTGPLHIAAAVGTPCVGFYGPTSGVRNGPYGAGHRVLQSEDGRVASIGVPTAVAAAVAVLEAGP